MKKVLFTMFVVLAAAFMLYGIADAISGVCSGCHTMHNSQDGAAVNGSGPADILLKSDCMGCHTTASAVGPRVDNATLLSAGSFADAFVTSDTNTHNVEDLVGFNAGGADDILTSNDPPGGSAAVLTKFSGANQLKCAGSNGCHGSHDSKATSWAGIQGYHHAGGSIYKFLEVATDNEGAGTAVAGTKDSTYESGGATASKHNIYVSDAATGISAFCNNCHDVFHGAATTDLTTNGLWNRHPTDISIATYLGASGVTVDYVNNPFAFTAAYATTLSTTSATGYDATNGYVMCLSCHRAHASEYADLLRFNYASQSAGGGGTTGCLGCHVNQR
ncbi:MAG: hypothetical protein HY809_02680 [Nitrospirae bacterium]|nr:hypothetical protein [Nitrospirota bacterium]